MPSFASYRGIPCRLPPSWPVEIAQKCRVDVLRVWPLSRLQHRKPTKRTERNQTTASASGGKCVIRSEPATGFCVLIDLSMTTTRYFQWLREIESGFGCTANADWNSTNTYSAHCLAYVYIPRAQGIKYIPFTHVSPGLSGNLPVLTWPALPNAWRCPTAQPPPALPQTCASTKIKARDSQRKQHHWVDENGMFGGRGGCCALVDVVVVGSSPREGVDQQRKNALGLIR